MARGNAANIRAKRNKAYKTKRTHAFSMIVVTAVAMMIVLIVGVGAAGLQEKKELLEAESIAIEEQIAQEEDRASEIEEYAKEVQTKRYYEKIAKEKLGLVHEDEILFKKED